MRAAAPILSLVCFCVVALAAPVDSDETPRVYTNADLAELSEGEGFVYTNADVEALEPLPALAIEPPIVAVVTARDRDDADADAEEDRLRTARRPVRTRPRTAPPAPAPKPNRREQNRAAYSRYRLVPEVNGIPIDRLYDRREPPRPSEEPAPIPETRVPHARFQKDPPVREFRPGLGDSYRGWDGEGNRTEPPAKPDSRR